MVQIIELKTERLKLRQWTDADKEQFATMSADPEVMRFFPATLTRTESDEIAHKCQTLLANRGWGIWAVELTEANTFIGIVGLHETTAQLPCTPCVEILWRLARPHWGKGYATEAASAALQVAFQRLQLNEIVSFAVPENTASRGVMERINMTNTGEDFEHPDVPENSHLRQHCLYKITRDDWLKLQN